MFAYKGKILGAHFQHHLVFFQYNDRRQVFQCLFMYEVPGNDGSRKHFTYKGMPLFSSGLIVLG